MVSSCPSFLLRYVAWKDLRNTSLTLFLVFFFFSLFFWFVWFWAVFYVLGYWAIVMFLITFFCMTSANGVCRNKLRVLDVSLWCFPPGSQETECCQKLGQTPAGFPALCCGGLPLLNSAARLEFAFMSLFCALVWGHPLFRHCTIIPVRKKVLILSFLSSMIVTTPITGNKVSILSI